MPEQTLPKSHSLRWPAITTLVLLLYIGSAAPIDLLFLKEKLPASLNEPVMFLLRPAAWVLRTCLSDRLHADWYGFWNNHLPGPVIQY